MSIEADLRLLVGRLRAADRARTEGQPRPDPGALRRVGLWDGSWSAVEAKRASLPMPACLVALTGMVIDHRALSMWRPGQLRAVDAQDPSPAPQVRAAIAATFIAADPSADARASAALALAEMAVPVLLAHGIEDVRGQNLYAPVLYRAGLSAFALLGHRRIELAPAHPPRRPPVQVAAADGSDPPETVWEAV